MIMRAGALLGLIALLAACSRKDAGTTDTGLAINTDTGAVAAMSDTGMGATPAGAMSDANIVYMLDWANAMDSSGGAVASTKGTNSEVRDFGNRMMRDHHNLRQQGQDLAKKLGVTPAPPANDTTQAHSQRMMSTLNGAAKGRDFDKAYIDGEVETHKAGLEMATSAMNAAQNAELKNLIQKAAPAIQAHLDMAQSIQNKLK
jgi:putative membrane protein